ncbi:MFS transporter [Corynebacterium kozikiae]|uniref:MFS transporter n=1 Tax=Corynebacterium kozikiae TaxID=2968469 RepID=UPI00211CC854|nr:MFS transporter [Corynebacterium sp. 76QC2CO]MCQ9343652.1 MFS transporter [Corynebacterium sp. 76QC2CO]
MRTDKKTVLSWALWDLGSAAFNAVMITFVFSVYLIESVGQHITTERTPTSWYGLAIGTAGVLIALLAPVIGQRSDARGTRRRGLRVWTVLTVALMAVLFFTENTAPGYFWFGLIVLAVASITFELAEVNYFAQLNQVSTKENVGRVSGFGWAMGYFGGIFLLLICYVGFISGEGGVFGLPTENGFNIRLVALVAAAWFLLAALPTMFRVPEIAPNPNMKGGSYRELVATLRRMWREDRNSVWFLAASAVFRDGLAGVFTFGALLAVSVYGLAADQVLLFGIAANVISALGALASGFLDDRFGPKVVIVGSLVAMLLTSAALYFGEGTTTFWVFGLILCAFVGPAQTASRSFLSRLAQDQREGEMFGLYATTGRAVSWMAPFAFAQFAAITGNDREGIFGLMLVLAIGCALTLIVRDPSRGVGARGGGHAAA